MKETCPCPPKHPTRTCGLLGSVATEARCMACSIVKVSCVVAKCKAKKCWETWQVIFPQPRAVFFRLCGVTDQRCVGISWIPIIVAESWQTLPGSTSSPPSHCHPDNSPRYFHQRIWDDPCCLAEMAQWLTNEQKSMVQPWHLRKLQFDIQWFQRKRKPGSSLMIKSVCLLIACKTNKVFCNAKVPICSAGTARNDWRW